MTEIEMGGAFEFTITASRHSLRMPDGSWREVVEWSVCLPHQCGAWNIAEVETKAEAVMRLEQFAAEAQATLERLRALPDDAHDAPPD
jgi:hypothetical protein